LSTYKYKTSEKVMKYWWGSARGWSALGRKAWKPFGCRHL